MKIIKKISDFLFALFFLVFILVMIVARNNFKINVELPINALSGFVVDTKENVYIADSFFAIIQKYDKQETL